MPFIIFVVMGGLSGGITYYLTDIIWLSVLVGIAGGITNAIIILEDD